MRDAVIVGVARTAVGKRNGMLAGLHPADLSAPVLEALVDRTGVNPASVDDVVWGCVSQIGEQTFNIGRTAVLSAGWPESVPATTVDRQCGSSQQALQFVSAGVMSGQYDIAVAGGCESMSRVPMGSAAGDQSPLGVRYGDRYGLEFPSQGVAAERIAEAWKLSRLNLDEFALRSHLRAAKATAAGLFQAEIIELASADDYQPRDEGIREDSTLDVLAKLRTPFLEDGVVSAGNSSQISDGAAALLVTTSELAAKNGWNPIARVHTAVAVGSDPNMMLTGILPATRRVLARSGLSLDDIGAFEVNEAFASVVLAWQRDFGVDEELINPLGGAIALGHPLGGSGARIATTLINHMERNGISYGLQVMCEGGGQANAMIFELVR